MQLYRVYGTLRTVQADGIIRDGKRFRLAWQGKRIGGSKREEDERYNPLR
jgi:hypothetical protein